ncbi:MAG: IS3 family transposase [Parcubacteria group bacterium]
MATLQTTKTALAYKLGIARSSLYYRPRQPLADQRLKDSILGVMQVHPAYGHRRIALDLNLNKKAIRRIMRLYGLKPKIRRSKYPTKPDDRNRPATRVPNVLKVLCPLRPNVVWAGDFTYLWYLDQFWYVATVIDVYTREIVGWHIANHHTTGLITQAFRDAVSRSGRSPTYFHSDQGSEYVSGSYAVLLASYGTLPSHSRKSSPWQNGHQESFYANFKLELGDLQRFNQVGELIEAVHQQINYYNTRRIHTALRMAPLVFKQLHIQKQIAYATSSLV